MDAGMRSCSLLCAVLPASVLAFAPVQAQALRDPTQPPPLSALAGRAGEALAAEGPVLNSVILSEGRKLATIDGKVYRTGDKLGDETVVAIAADQVTLRGKSGTKVLRLYPQVLKAADPADTQARSAATRPKAAK
jgi:hypothetical protein